MMEPIDVTDRWLLHLLPQSWHENDDEFNRRKYAMEDNVQSIVAGGGAMHSVYRMSLPFHVDTVKRVRFLGTTTDGCRFAHVDLAERRKLEVEQVIMIDTNRKLPSSGQKRSYSSL
jgi:hypothetical protein